MVDNMDQSESIRNSGHSPGSKVAAPFQFQMLVPILTAAFLVALIEVIVSTSFAALIFAGDLSDQEQETYDEIPRKLLGIMLKGTHKGFGITGRQVARDLADSDRNLK